MKVKQYFVRGLRLLIAGIPPAALTWAAASFSYLWLWANKVTAHLDIIAPTIAAFFILTIFVPLYGWLSAIVERNQNPFLPLADD